MAESSLSGHVYVLRTNTTIDGQEVIKIGMTRNSVEKRVRQLHTGSPVRMEVAYSLKVENAKAFEKELHFRYRSNRVTAGGGREFFKIPAADVILHIEERAASISRAKARAAFAADLVQFEYSIGIGQIRRKISAACVWSALIVMVVTTGILFMIFRNGIGLLGVFPGLFFWIWVATKIEDRLKDKLIEVPYQHDLRRIRAKLNAKYPLARADDGSPYFGKRYG